MRPLALARDDRNGILQFSRALWGLRWGIWSTNGAERLGLEFDLHLDINVRPPAVETFLYRDLTFDARL